MEQSIIYVLAPSGKPLMPTKNRNKVWYWLRRGLARVVSREPFTIQLRFETTSYTQPITVGGDTCSQTVGRAGNNQSQAVLQAACSLHRDISNSLLHLPNDRLRP